MKYKYKKYGLVCYLLFFMMIVSSVNAYADTRSVTAYIPVSCVGKNTSEEFVYQLKAGSTADQTDEIDSLKLKDGGKSMFHLTYTDPGTHEYEVTQTKGTDKNTTYVTEDDAGLNTDVIAYKSGSDQKVSELKFQNEKKADDTGKSDNGKGTSGSNGTKNPVVPGAKTGDIGNMAVWIGGTSIAFLAVIIMLMRRRRKV